MLLKGNIICNKNSVQLTGSVCLAALLDVLKTHTMSRTPVGVNIRRQSTGPRQRESGMSIKPSSHMSSAVNDSLSNHHYVLHPLFVGQWPLNDIYHPALFSFQTNKKTFKKKYLSLVYKIPRNLKCKLIL